MRKAREDIGIALLANSGIFVPLAKCSSIWYSFKALPRVCTGNTYTARGGASRGKYSTRL